MEDSSTNYEIRQRYGKNEQYEFYSISKGGKSIEKRRDGEPQSRIDKNIFTHVYVALFQVIREVFLPEGYPNSVSGDYLAYQFWDTIQAFCSSINNILATQGVLKGSGVGDVKATAMAATITWVLKSGSGMLGSILFAWARGSHLDCYCKQWRFTADVLNDFATFIEILAPTAGPDYFLYVMCIAGIAKSIVGVAGGSTRAAVTSHQARHGNMADVSAKDGSQETLVNLSALLLGLVMIPIVNENIITIWSLYIILTALHLYANYRAVRVLNMEFVNLIRLQIVMRHYFNHGTIKSVEETNREEPIFLSFFTRSTDYELGAKLISGSTTQIASLENGFIFQKGKEKLCVALEENFSTEVLLECVFYAELYNWLQNNPATPSLLPWNHALKLKVAELSNELSEVNENYRIIFEDFNCKFKQSEWNADVIKVCTSPWRFKKLTWYSILYLQDAILYLIFSFYFGFKYATVSNKVYSK